MIETPDISIIVPVYNATPYIYQCATSLFSQTKDNLEYIFVDDCSTDDSIKELKRAISLFPDIKPKVKIIRNPCNAGPAAARYKGFMAAKGRYIAMVDADDYIAEDMYAKMFALACEGNYDIVMSNINVVEEDKDYRMGMTWDDTMPDNGMALVSMLLRRHQLPVDVLWNKIFKRELIINNKTIIPRRYLSEDFLYLIQWYSFAERIGFISTPLCNYRVHSGSLSSDMNALECRFGRLEHLKDAKLFLKKNSLYSCLYDEILWCHKAEEVRIASIGTHNFRRLWTLSTKPLLSMIWLNGRFNIGNKIIETAKRFLYFFSTLIR